MKLNDIGIVREGSEITPNDAMTLHRAKFHKDNDEFICDGEYEGVSWKLYKGFESYFLKIHYGSLLAKLVWDGSSSWISEESSDPTIIGCDISQIVQSIKDHVKEFD